MTVTTIVDRLALKSVRAPAMIVAMVAIVAMIEMVVLVGCSTAPVVEMDVAEYLRAESPAVGSPEAAPDRFGDARLSLDAVEIRPYGIRVAANGRLIVDLLIEAGNYRSAFWFANMIESSLGSHPDEIIEVRSPTGRPLRGAPRYPYVQYEMPGGYATELPSGRCRMLARHHLTGRRIVDERSEYRVQLVDGDWSDQLPSALARHGFVSPDVTVVVDTAVHTFTPEAVTLRPARDLRWPVVEHSAEPVSIEALDPELVREGIEIRASAIAAAARDGQFGPDSDRAAVTRGIIGQFGQGLPISPQGRRALVEQLKEELRTKYPDAYARVYDE